MRSPLPKRTTPLHTVTIPSEDGGPDRTVEAPLVLDEQDWELLDELTRLIKSYKKDATADCHAQIMEVLQILSDYREGDMELVFSPEAMLRAKNTDMTLLETELKKLIWEYREV
ncbi:MAG: hypothetical protein WCV84_01235 [Patescibacteria group bacterium]